MIHKKSLVPSQTKYNLILKPGWYAFFEKKFLEIECNEQKVDTVVTFDASTPRLCLDAKEKEVTVLQVNDLDLRKPIFTTELPSIEKLWNLWSPSSNWIVAYVFLAKDWECHGKIQNGPTGSERSFTFTEHRLKGKEGEVVFQYDKIEIATQNTVVYILNPGSVTPEKNGAGKKFYRTSLPIIGSKFSHEQAVVILQADSRIGAELCVTARTEKTETVTVTSAPKKTLGATIESGQLRINDDPKHLDTVIPRYEIRYYKIPTQYLEKERWMRWQNFFPVLASFRQYFQNGGKLSFFLQHQQHQPIRIKTSCRVFLEEEMNTLPLLFDPNDNELRKHLKNWVVEDTPNIFRHEVLLDSAIQGISSSNPDEIWQEIERHSTSALERLHAKTWGRYGVRCVPWVIVVVLAVLLIRLYASAGVNYFWLLFCFVVPCILQNLCSRVTGRMWLPMVPQLLWFCALYFPQWGIPAEVYTIEPDKGWTALNGGSRRWLLDMDTDAWYTAKIRFKPYPTNSWTSIPAQLSSCSSNNTEHCFDLGIIEFLQCQQFIVDPSEEDTSTILKISWKNFYVRNAHGLLLENIEIECHAMSEQFLRLLCKIKQEPQSKGKLKVIMEKSEQLRELLVNTRLTREIQARAAYLKTWESGPKVFSGKWEILGEKVDDDQSPYLKMWHIYAGRSKINTLQELEKSVQKVQEYKDPKEYQTLLTTYLELYSRIHYPEISLAYYVQYLNRHVKDFPQCYHNPTTKDKVKKLVQQLINYQKILSDLNFPEDSKKKLESLLGLQIFCIEVFEEGGTNYTKKSEFEEIEKRLTKNFESIPPEFETYLAVLRPLLNQKKIPITREGIIEIGAIKKEIETHNNQYK